MQIFTHLAGLTERTMKRLVWCAAMVLLPSGCADRVPVAPTSPGSSSVLTAESATLTGQVYARVDWGDPPLADVVIEVKTADGSDKSTITDEDGFYELVVRPGAMSITAFRDGYEAKTWELTLSRDTVLNFGLTPK
jgi:hypothetical protein